MLSRGKSLKIYLSMQTLHKILICDSSRWWNHVFTQRDD